MQTYHEKHIFVQFINCIRRLSIGIQHTHKPRTETMNVNYNDLQCMLSEMRLETDGGTPNRTKMINKPINFVNNLEVKPFTVRCNAQIRSHFTSR